jgi:asparagine synthase (glutamine-hydrolysing)
MLAAGQLGSAARLLRASAALPGASTAIMLQTVVGMATPPAIATLGRRIVRRELAPPWIDRQWLARCGVRASHPWRARLAAGALGRHLRDALTMTSLPMLLRFEDRNSMRHSIESRVPFVNPSLVAFILSLPESYLLDDGGTTKSVFRRAMRGLVPDPVLDRRDKLGFATPERRWLSELTPWVTSMLRDGSADLVPALRADVLHGEWAAVARGERPFDFRIWRWVNCLLWSQQFAVRHD